MEVLVLNSSDCMDNSVSISVVPVVPKKSKRSKTADTRKDKSLSAICEKFLEQYPLEMPYGCSAEIPLEQLTASMNLSRRRLYDIINIMESLHMAVKVSKNVYRWYGTRNVQKLLTQLKAMSEQEMVIELEKLANALVVPDGDSQPTTPLQPPCTPLEGQMSAQALLLQSMNKVQAFPYSGPPTNSKKKACNLQDSSESPEPKGIHSWKLKSLGGTCLKFLTLFFKHKHVSLEWAGRVLLCGDDDFSSQSSSQSSQSSQGSEDSRDQQDRQLRNKIRRIYDVANVLCALGLVRKIIPRRLSPTRKVLYGYCGPAIGKVEIDVKQEAHGPKDQLLSTERPDIPLVKSEARPSSEGLCKRRLDLGQEDEANIKRLRSLQDDVLSELGDSASAMSVLLAVAERELKDSSDNQQTPPASEKTKLDPTVTSQLVPIASTSQASTIVDSENMHHSGKMNPPLLVQPKFNAPTQPIVVRSALRSLLENNTSGPKKPEYPAIRNFVVDSEKYSRISLLVPSKQQGLRSPIPTLFIRNATQTGVVARKTGLIIPCQVNPSVSRTVTTHLVAMPTEIGNLSNNKQIK